MTDLAALLQASLSPTTRKQAEHSLDSLVLQEGFLPHLLTLVLDQSKDQAVRLAGAIFLKNLAKLRWDENVDPLKFEDKALIRSQLVPAMLALSNPSDKSIRAQISESVSLIAGADFPDRWPDVIGQLVNSLSATSYAVNIAVLETAHSIFRPWRFKSRSDKLFTEINLVLGTFIQPFLQLFRQTANMLFTETSTSTQEVLLLARAQRILVDIYYDFTSQDLPPALEDTLEEFFKPQTGWFQKFLLWDPAQLRTDVDEQTPSLPSQIKTGVLEIAELFLKLYAEDLARIQSVEGFIEGVWNSVGSGRLPSIADDPLVSQSLRFLSIAIRTGHYRQLFGTKETISRLVQGIAIPNVGLREHEVERFEDDPLEFVRLDISLPSSGSGVSDTSTRRQAAADLLQALVGSGYEAEATEIVGTWIAAGLQEWATNPTQNWKAKDTAIYLFTAIATRGSTMLHGVTSTNPLVDVVKFFSEHVLQDLQAGQGDVHPILQVDAIRFLYTFRHQLTKAQLLAVLPQLARHLISSNYVTYTYAAIAIERILFIKQNRRLLFSSDDIRDMAPGLLDVILAKIEAAGTSEKMAENDYLMKCANRVIFVAREGLDPLFERVLGRLIGILTIISKNPSNPHFDQYTFESISALMRFIVGASPTKLETFKQALFGPLTMILQQDIDQYIPYVFQILAQMLHLHTSNVPVEFRNLLPFLLTPAIWQQKGSIPGLVKLLREMLAKDGEYVVSTGSLVSVLAVVRQRLIPSKLNDEWGLLLLQGVVQYISVSIVAPYFRPTLLTLLTRLQSSKTDKYLSQLVYFLLFLMTQNVSGYGPDFLIFGMEGLQEALWLQFLKDVILPQIPQTPSKDRKLVAVALTRLLTESEYMLQEPGAQAWPATFTTLAKLFRDPQFLQNEPTENVDGGMTEIDYEEQTAGYQAAYTRLVATETAPIDPVAYVPNPLEYLGKSLTKAFSVNPKVKEWIQAGDMEAVGPLIQELTRAGYII